MNHIGEVEGSRSFLYGFLLSLRGEYHYIGGYQIVMYDIEELESIHVRADEDFLDL